MNLELIFVLLFFFRDPKLRLAQSTDLYWIIFLFFFLQLGFNLQLDMWLWVNFDRSFSKDYLIFHDFFNKLFLLNVKGIFHFFRYAVVIFKVEIFLLWVFVRWRTLQRIIETFWFFLSNDFNLFWFLFFFFLFVSFLNFLKVSRSRLFILSISCLLWPTP